MKRNLSELFEKAEYFVSNLNRKDKLIIIHDSDVDGVCSAVVTIFALRKFGIKHVLVVARDPEFLRKYGTKCEFSDKNIILDLSSDLFEKDLKKIKNSKKKFLIFDHHMIWKINSKNVFYVNPRIVEKEIYLPASYLVFKFFSEFINIKDVEWIASLGTIGDYGIYDTKDLIGKYFKKKDYKDIWNSEYGKAAMVLNSAIAIIGAKKTLKILLQMKSFEQLERNVVFRRVYEKFEKEFRKVKNEMMKKMEDYPEIGLKISIIKPKYRRIGSTLATKLGMKNKNSVLIILERFGNVYRIHGRSTAPEVSVASLFKRLGVGGGHTRSGGGTIKVKELKEFRMSLIKEIGKMRHIARKKG